MYQLCLSRLTWGERGLGWDWDFPRCALRDALLRVPDVFEHTPQSLPLLKGGLSLDSGKLEVETLDMDLSPQIPPLT